MSKNQNKIDLIAFHWPVISALMFFPTLALFTNYQANLFSIAAALIVFGAFSAIIYAVVRTSRLSISFWYKVIWCLLFVWVWPVGTAIGYWVLIRKKRGVPSEP